MANRVEHCRNPWDKTCNSSDIEVYILIKGDRLPICKGCWGKLAEKELEW